MIELGIGVLRALDVFQDILVAGLDWHCACSRLGRQRNLFLNASAHLMLIQIHIRSQEVSQVVVDVLNLDMALLGLGHNIGRIHSLGGVS